MVRVLLGILWIIGLLLSGANVDTENLYIQSSVNFLGLAIFSISSFLTGVFYNRDI